MYEKGADPILTELLGNLASTAAGLYPELSPGTNQITLGCDK